MHGEKAWDGLWKGKIGPLRDSSGRILVFSLREERGILLQDCKNIQYLLLGYVAAVQTNGRRLLEAQGLCYPVVCAHPHGKPVQSTGSASWRKSPMNRTGGRKWPGAWKDREGQATLEPILRPQSPGLSCAGCQPLTTHPAPKALAVPINCLWLTHLPCGHLTHLSSVADREEVGREGWEREIVDHSVHRVDRQMSHNSGTSSLTSP